MSRVRFRVIFIVLVLILLLASILFGVLTYGLDSVQSPPPGTEGGAVDHAWMSAAESRLPADSKLAKMPWRAVPG